MLSAYRKSGDVVFLEKLCKLLLTSNFALHLITNKQLTDNSTIMKLSPLLSAKRLFALAATLLKAQVSWIVARQDRAWYATADAKRRLTALGQTDDQIYALDGDWSKFAPKEKAIFTVARQLAASPIVLTDAEAAEAVKQCGGNRDVVQLIHYTNTRASFNRITEAAALPAEGR